MKLRDASGSGVAVAAVLLVAAAALAIYLPTPGNQWIRYDNEALIRASPQVAAFAEGNKLAALWTIFTSSHFSLYQPLFTLSVAIDHALFGWDLAGFHWHSVLLHAVMAGLLVLFLFRLTGNALVAGAVGLLVAVHPALVETVRWAICRNSQVAVIWLLLGSTLYLAWLDRREGRLLAFSQIAFAISLLGKLSPAIAAVPLLLDLWRHRRIDRRALVEKLPLFALSVLLTFVNYRATLEHFRESPLRRPWTEILARLPGAAELMVANAIAPVNLAILYSPDETGAFLGARRALVLLFLLAAVAGGIWAWKRGRRGVLLGLAGFLLLLLPNVAAGRFRATIASDRYLYIPIVFLAAALAAALVPRRSTGEKAEQPAVAPLLAPASTLPWVAAALAIVLAAPLALATRAETVRWKDERLIWDRVNRFAPHYMAYHSLGKLALEAQDWSGAASHFERALALARKDPYIKDDSLYYSAFMQTSRKAAEQLQQNPDPAAQAERERLLAEAGQVAEEAAKKLPGDAGLQFEAGKTKYKQKLYREAIVALESAIALDPRHDQAWMYKAMCQYYLGEIEPSIASFRTALGIRRHTLTFSNLSKVLAAQSRFPETAEVLLEWLEVEPTQRDAHNRYLQVTGAMVDSGQAAAAAASLTKYLARFPDSPAARALLARAQGAKGPAA